MLVQRRLDASRSCTPNLPSPGGVFIAPRDSQPPWTRFGSNGSMKMKGGAAAVQRAARDSFFAVSLVAEFSLD